MVIVGDEADAEELALALARDTNVVLVSARQVEAPRLLSVERPGATSEPIAAANIHQARAVVVMLADEKANAAIATAIASGRDGDADPTMGSGARLAYCPPRRRRRAGRGARTPL